MLFLCCRYVHHPSSLPSLFFVSFPLSTPAFSSLSSEILAVAIILLHSSPDLSSVVPPPPLLVLPLYSLSLHLPSSTTLILSPSLTLFPKSFPTSTTTSSPSSSPSPSFPLSLHLSPHPPLLYFFISPPFLSPGHC